ncbi:MAG: FAD-binding oxidoreductase [Acidobacteria bacterium]|nr:MAG: FAD-binding oxidoreductase [Acidobacteriota bacterium]
MTAGGGEARRRVLGQVVAGDQMRPMPGGALLVEPRDVEQMGRVVALAHEHGWTVLPRGGGTSSGRAAGAGRPDIVVSTARLDRLLFHDPARMVATAECGIPVRELQRQLRARKQFLPLDPPLPPAATLGGLLATNAFGPRRIRYGTARDWVLGTELVRFDGERLPAGAPAAGNASGYDLSQLYVGAWGSLGILARVHLKLAPWPPAAGLLCVSPLEREPAAALVARLLGRPLPLTAALFRSRALDAPGELLLLFEGLPELIERQVDAAAAWLRQEGAPHPPRSSAGSSARREIGEAIAGIAEPPPALRLRLNYAPGDYAPLIAELATADLGAAAEVSLPGSGVTWLVWRSVDGAREEELLRRAGEIVAVREGWAMVDRRPPERPWRGPAVVPAPESLELMRRLRRALDPAGTFPDPPFLEGT